MRHAVFSPYGLRVVSSGDNGTVRIWEVQPDARPADDLVQAARVLVGHRGHEGCGLMPIGPDDMPKQWMRLHFRYPD